MIISDLGHLAWHHKPAFVIKQKTIELLVDYGSHITINCFRSSEMNHSMLRFKKYLYQTILLCVLFSFISCAHTPKSVYYRLESISDSASGNSKEVVASVLLRNTGSNRVAVFNLEKKYSMFYIYKREQGEFKRKGTLSPGQPSSPLQSADEMNIKIIYFEDSSNSSIDDRYRVVPVVDGVELAPLKIYYDTEDSSYFKKIEGREPVKK